MTKTTPRGPTPSLIGSTNGRPRRVTVVRKSACYRCHVDLLGGHACIELPKLGGAYASVKRLCDECFQAIIAKTSQDLDELRKI